MLYEQANERLTGRNSQRRKLENNTYLERREDGRIGVRLHGTDVVMFRPDGAVVLDSGGWLTVTTKARMNEFLPGSWKVWSDKGVWYVGQHGNGIVYPYADGMVIYPDGRVEGAGEVPQESKKLKRQIAKYVEGYMTAFFAGDVPAPSNGDCWFCLMTVTSPAKDAGKGLGESFRDTEHLREHLRESYFVPSLLVRATKRFPVSPAANHCIAAMWSPVEEMPEKFRGMARVDVCGGWKDLAKEQLGKSLRRYLGEQFGFMT